MGTHPIFESDFDCLTDIRMSMDEATNNMQLVPREFFEALKTGILDKIQNCPVSSKVVPNASDVTDMYRDQSWYYQYWIWRLQNALEAEKNKVKALQEENSSLKKQLGLKPPSTEAVSSKEESTTDSQKLLIESSESELAKKPNELINILIKLF